MGKKDIITKEYMEDTEVFADVFNHMIYKGEKVIDPKNLKDRKSTRLNSSHITRSRMPSSA